MTCLKVVYNPLHFQGARQVELTRMRDRLRAEHIRGELIPLAPDKLTAAALVSRLAETRAVIVAGGDGTLNRVVNMLMKQKHELPLPPLALWPAGTANDFARQLSQGNLRRSPEEILSAIRAGKTCRVDLGQVNDRYFVNVVGAGMLVDVAHVTSHYLKRRWGMIAYYYEGLRHIFSYRPFQVTIKEKGRCYREEVLLVLVLNSKGAGGFSRLVPPASFNDGKLDLLLFKSTGSAGLVSILPRLVRGDHLQAECCFYKQVECLQMEAFPKLETDVDGEPGPPFPLSIGVLPGRLRFIIW